RYVDDEGNYVELNSNEEALPNNFIADTLYGLFVAGTPFTYPDVEQVTYTLVDPDKNIVGDEYYDYSLSLNTGDTRGITIAQFSSISNMRERFASIGYRDDVIKLLVAAEETSAEEDQSLIREV